jgi:pilus assembly protein CpaB
MKAARVVVLTVALAAGGVAAMLAGRPEKPAEVKTPQAPQMASTDILVAKNDIPMGQAVSPGDMQWQAWPAGTAAGNFIRRTEQPSAIDQFSGNIARLPFVAGEPMREAKLVNAKGSGFMAAILPKGMRAIATQISAETGAGGFILPNDRVDVILSRRDREAEKQTGVEVQVSETILSNIRVLAIDQTVEEKNTQKSVIGKTATLELSERQAETLALAQKLGSLSLALRSITDASNEGPKEDDTANASRAGVHIIRFGVGTVVTPK